MSREGCDIIKNLKYIGWIKQVTSEDIPPVGDKNGSPGEIDRGLTTNGIQSPDGFATTAPAYDRLGCHCGICGLAPSDSPEFNEFLVEENIDSISLSPDSVIKVTAATLEMERKMT